MASVSLSTPITFSHLYDAFTINDGISESTEHFTDLASVVFSNDSGTDSLENTNFINFLPHCSITDFNDINLKLKNNASSINLNIIQLNCRSLSKSYLNIKTLLSSINYKPSLIALSETWISADFVELYAIEGYKLLLLPRKGKRGGGIGYYVDVNLDYEICDDVAIGMEMKFCEYLVIKIKSKHSANFTIVNCYRPPSTNVNDFIGHLSELLECIDNSNTRSNLIVTGDFNIDLLNKSNKATNKFLDTMYSYNLIPTILSATRVTDSHQSLLDNIFVSTNLGINISGILLEDISDHFVTFATIKPIQVDKKLSQIPLPNGNISYKYSKANFYYFKNLLDGYDWDNLHQLLIDLRSKDNSELLFNTFLDVFLALYNTAFKIDFPKSSYQSARTPKREKPILPWLTPELLRFCKIKSHLFKLYKRFKTNVAKIKYRNYARNLKNIIKKAEKDYYSKLFNNKTTNEEIWKNINAIMKPASSKQINNEYLINGKTITDPKVICEEFNNYFITIGDKIANQIPVTNDRPQDFLDKKIYPSCFLSPTSIDEIRTTITHLKQSSSPGPDNIHPSAIKIANNYISPILVTLINYSFTDAIFPSILKQALVIPIYKADDKKDLTNYRPISVLNAFSKIYENIIKNRLMSHIDKYNIIFNHQYGFRKNYSTYMSIISLIDKITENLNNNNFTLALFLDF